MKKLLKSKKALAATALALMLAIGGGTYAWFTTEGNAAVATVTLGQLGVAAEYTVDVPEGSYFEPGTSLVATGAMKSTSNIGLFLKVDSTGVIEKSDGTAETYTTADAADPESPAYLTVDNSQVGFSLTKDIFWFTDGTNYYVMCGPDSTDKLFDTDVEFVFSGPNMGNDYQSATASIATAWKGTQTNPQAIEDELLIDFDSLTMCLDNDLDAGVRRSFNAEDQRARAIARVNEIVYGN